MKRIVSPPHPARARLNVLNRVGPLVVMVLAASGLVFLSSGCATLKGLLASAIEDPKVTIVGVHLRGMTLETLSTTFDVEIENPNAVGLMLAGIEYQLHVEGEPFAQGQSQKGVSLAPLGTTRAVLDVDFPLHTAAKPLKKVLEQKQLNYTLDTVFLLGTESTNLAIPARFEGMVDLPKAPEVDVVEVSFPEVSSSGVQVRLLCQVSNPNRFDIPIDELRLSFSFGGREILKNQPIAGVVLHAGQTTAVPVDFSVGLSDLGLSLSSLADKPELRWKLVLKLVSGDSSLPYERGGRTSLLPSFGAEG